MCLVGYIKKKCITIHDNMNVKFVKLSHHHSDNPVEFDCVLEHLLVDIEFWAIWQMFLIHGGAWHSAYCAVTRFIYASFS